MVMRTESLASVRMAAKLAVVLSMTVVAGVVLPGSTEGLAAPSVSTSSLLRKAKKDFLSANFTAASPKFYELLERDLAYPELRDVLVSLCESTLREGKLAEADSVAAEAARRLSDVAGLERIGFLRGEIYYFSGRMDEALDAYLTFLEMNPESRDVNDVIGRLLLMDENSDHDRIPLAAYSRADFLQFAGAADSALAVLDMLLKSFPGAQIADDALMKRGDVLSSQGELLEAVAGYGLVEERFPESHLVPVCKLKTAELYVKQLHEKEKAIAEYEEIITGFPGTSFAVEARNLLEKLKESGGGR